MATQPGIDPRTAPIPSAQPQSPPTPPPRPIEDQFSQFLQRNQDYDPSTATIIGEGAFGIVWKVFHRSLQQWYAIKVVAEPSSNDARIQERFKTEPIINKYLTHLSQNPSQSSSRSFQYATVSLLKYYNHEVKDTPSSSGEKRQFMFMTMEYLHQDCSKKRPSYYVNPNPRTPFVFQTYHDITLMDIPSIESIMMQLLIVADFIHMNGILHRDIKPDNLLLIQPEFIPGNGILDDDGIYTYSIDVPIVKLIDFGLGRRFEVRRDNDDLTKSQISTTCISKSLVGTPIYQAPELNGNEVMGIPVDLYAIGITIYTYLFGYCPDFSCAHNSHEAHKEVQKLYSLDDYLEEYNIIHRNHTNYIRSKQKLSRRSLKIHPRRELSPALKEAMECLLNPDPMKRGGVYKTEWYQANLEMTEGMLTKYAELAQISQDQDLTNLSQSHQSQGITTLSDSVGNGSDNKTNSQHHHLTQSQRQQLIHDMMNQYQLPQTTTAIINYANPGGMGVDGDRLRQEVPIMTESEDVTKDGEDGDDDDDSDDSDDESGIMGEMSFDIKPSTPSNQYNGGSDNAINDQKNDGRDGNGNKDNNTVMMMGDHG